ncbi:hypothetical protein ACFR9U_01930 [Halorientalis brevis]|uniref:Uncharacterized protein n=1 Tax=Halorientalis brevis TaxID=1126241 RepID=A0ABD6C794_9EURY|nr:hypothetical protein [Halorientalis brevis]
MTDRVELVERSLSADTYPTFGARVEEQAAFLREELARGALDTDGFAVGLELEVYAVDDGALTRIPDDVFDACNKELGLHNAELNTDPDPFTTAGIEAQADALRTQWAAAQNAARDAGCDLVLDAMWTLPPDEGSYQYLAATEQRDGVTVPSNMRAISRYWGIDRDCVRKAGGEIEFDVPGASISFPTILFESLATSIQPHVQIPSTDAFPRYYNAAIRTLGPVLALATNSPFLPGDLYDEDVDPERLLTETHHELRIAAFEQSVNQTGERKVRVPDDVETATDVVDYLVADPVVSPFLSEWLAGEGEGDVYADNFWELDHKRGTYWRWLRTVIGGDPVDGLSDERSLRIEYRPLPTQPSIRDIVGFQCLVGGLVNGLVVDDHPLTDLDWDAAEACFYSVVENGLDAEFAWITADGERTDDPETVFAEVFEYARRGLDDLGVAESTVETYLGPLETRWEARTTPSQWKIERVREALADGADLQAALATMQTEYVRRSNEHDTFAEWL